MAFAYTQILEEDLGYGYYRIFYGHDVSDGVMLSVRVVQKVPGSGHRAITQTRQVFLTGYTVATLSGLSFVTLETEDLQVNQQLITRSALGGSLINTTLFVNTNYGGAVVRVPVLDILTSVGAGQGEWFRWNDSDLTQFDAKATGPNVASSIADVVAYLGLNWIRLSITSDAIAANGAQQALILPITQTPPSADYAVYADFLSIAKVGNLVGAGVLVRYNGLTSYYLTRYNDSSAVGQQRTDKITAGYTITNIGSNTDEPTATVGIGAKFGLAVEGQSLVQPDWGERQLIADAASPITSAGKAALFCTTSGVINSTATNYFRNVRCVSL